MQTKQRDKKPKTAGAAVNKNKVKPEKQMRNIPKTNFYSEQ